jgi:hypothetical protein
MILYNKYTGTFRFFGAILNQLTDYGVVRIELRIPQTSPNFGPNGENLYQSDLKATNLLSIQGETIQPLDEETDETSLVVFAQATNNTNNMFWFDMPVAFDPCLCNIRSQLDITFTFLQTGVIDINGVPETGVKNSTTPGEYAQKVAGRVFAAVLSTAVAIKTGGTVINFKAYTDLVKLVRENPNANLSQEQKDNLENLENFLSCSANFAKVVNKNYKGLESSSSVAKKAAAEKLLDGSITFASALTNGCVENDKAGTASTGAFVARGTHTTASVVVGTPVRLAMPGSKWSDTRMQINDYSENGKYVPVYPSYNERLGTFALLETPEIKVSSRLIEGPDDFKAPTYLPSDLIDHPQPITHQLKVYKIDPQGSLKYIFNPKMNVNLDETRIQVRYVVKQNLDVRYNGIMLHGVTLTPRNVVKNTGIGNSETYYSTSTPYLPIEYYDNSGPIILPLRESTFKQKYKSDGTPIYTYSNPEHPYFNYQDSLFIQFKVLMTSNDVGRNGNNQAYYVFTYPVKVAEEIDVQDPDPLPLPSPLTIEALEQWNIQNQFRLVLTASIFTSNEPSLNGENKSFDQDIIFQDDEVFFYDGIVDVSAKLSTIAGKKVTIYSTLGFELLDGAEIGSNIELVIGYPYVSSPIPPQTHTQVSSFCSNTTKYKAQTFSTAALKEEEKVYLDRQRRGEKMIEAKNKQSLNLSLYPNPTNKDFTLGFDLVLSNVSVSVTDINGKVVYTRSFSGMSSKVRLDATQLEAGVYFIDVRDTNGKVGRERLVKY